MADNSTDTPIADGSPEPEATETTGERLGDFLGDDAPEGDNTDPAGEATEETPADPGDETDKPTEEPKEETPPEENLEGTAAEISQEARELIESLDPELEKASPALHKRVGEMIDGVNKVVAKTKEISADYDTYRKIDEAIFDPEASADAVRILVEEAAAKTGVDKAAYAKALGLDVAAPVIPGTETPVDPDEFDLSDPYDRTKFVDAVQSHNQTVVQKAVADAIEAYKAQITPELEKLTNAYKQQVEINQQTQQRETIRTTVPKVQKTLQADHSEFKATSAEIEAAAAEYPDIFAKDPVKAAKLHLHDRIIAHERTVAATRSQKGAPIDKSDSPVGVVEPDDVSKWGLGEFVNALDI